MAQNFTFSRNVNGEYEFDYEELNNSVMEVPIIKNTITDMHNMAYDIYIIRVVAEFFLILAVAYIIIYFFIPLIIIFIMALVGPSTSSK